MPDFLFCYDVSDPRRLGRVHRYLRRHALALQKSVFLFSGSTQQRDGIWAGLLERVDPVADDVRCYCFSARGLRVNLGLPMLAEGLWLSGTPEGF